MPKKKLTANPEKCDQRRRIAVRKGEATGLAIVFRSIGDGNNLGQPVAETAGYIPSDPEECLAMIHALQPEGATPVAADDVYLHVIEAANSNFIPDRFMFLAESTLRNIAAAGPTGISFMNSHRTGALSQPSELPFGQTFAGQFFAEGVGPARKCTAQLGIFLRRGVRPNGAQGPSTDDLHAMIEAGALRDVSVGLYGGRVTCDVCQNDYYDGAACKHYAGTTEAMGPDEMTAQADRGVPDGKCSVTLADATLGEVSAVYDGAVPSAGARKILAAGRASFSPETWEQAVHAFGPILGNSSPTESFLPDGLFAELSDAVREGVTAAFAAQPEAGLAPVDQGEPMAETNHAPAPVPEDGAPTVALQSDLAALQAETARQADELRQLREQNEKLLAERRQARFASIVSGADGQGRPWVGEQAKHVAMMESLASAFGEDSGEFRFYVEQNRVHAALAASSDAFREVGRDGQPALFHADVQAEVDAKVAQVLAATPGLTRAKAEAAVFEAHPDLYARYREAQR